MLRNFKTSQSPAFRLTNWKTSATSIGITASWPTNSFALDRTPPRPTSEKFPMTGTPSDFLRIREQIAATFHFQHTANLPIGTLQGEYTANNFEVARF
jgi:hypothetical protein